jgi:hypothetical protein
VKVITHLHPVLKPKMVELYLHSTICFHGAMLKLAENLTFIVYVTFSIYIFQEYNSFIVSGQFVR